MFSRIRQAISSFVNKISEGIVLKELSQEDFESYFQDLEVNLLEADVAYDVVQLIKDSIASKVIGRKVRRFSNASDYVKEVIKDSIKEFLLSGLYRGDFIEEIRNSAKPYIVVFMGVNGVGKTTTIAKVAYLLKNNNLRPVIVAADTFRAGAQEQLEVHARRLNIPFIGGKYKADPAAVARDGITYAQRNFIDVALIDTAGRMHTDLDLMNEVKKVVRVVKPHKKILVLDALTGNDAVNQARWFDEHVGVDAVILTKLDADVKGGSALSIIMTIGKPILFLGVGQQYTDLMPYNPLLILEKLLD